jgi:hypothetical protein
MASTKTIAQRLLGAKVPDDVKELAADLGHDFDPVEITTVIAAAARKGFTLGNAPTLEQVDAAVVLIHDGRLIDDARKYARAEIYSALTEGPR